ncbi:hypothetical protein C0585_02000 [Candidatus Woesearchaeota archaeon]|nr:MAG: hypothetical protein C0585_02000 [Candidatus Woesearchaeota archaeon]
MYKRFLVIICLFLSFSIFSITHNFFVTDLNVNSVSFIFVNGNSINNYEEKTIGFKFGDFKIIEINVNDFKIYQQSTGNILKIDKNNRQETIGNDPFLGSDSNFIQSGKDGNNYHSNFHPGVYDESMLTPDMLKILKEKKFLVVPELEAVAMSKLYRNTKYPYITIDSIYDAFFCLMSDFLTKAEICNKKLLKDFVNKLFFKLKKLSENNSEKYLNYYRYIGVPYIILNKEYEISKDLFNKDCSSYKDLILAYDNEENLSSYKPRGYYALEELKDYFVAMNFLGRKRFVINDSEDLEKIYDLIEVIQEEDLISIYEKIEGYYSFLNGEQDNNEIFKLLELKKDKKNLNEIFKNLKTSRIIDFLKDEMNEKEVKEFRLFGKRYVPESEVISSLFKKNKKINAIDIMQLFGNKYADNIAKNKSEIPETDYDNFKKILNKKENTLSYKLIDIMKSSFEADEKAKDIFHKDVYKAKMLNSSLSMWALKKRLFLLSEKESDQYIRGSISPLEFHGFVEPVPASFEKIHETTEYIIRNLKELGFFYKKINYYRFKYDFRYLKCFEFLSKKAKDLSITAQKQIDDEPLLEKDIKVFKGYDSFLRFIYQLNPSAYADDDMTKVVSMYSNKEEGYVHNLGVGRAMPIFCLYPYKGREYLTIGGILPFYEFNTTNHITDYRFTEMLDIKDKRLNFADWQKNFIYYKSSTRKKENTTSLKEINDQKIKLFLNTLTNKDTKSFYKIINEYFLRRVIYFRRSESHSRFIVDVIKKFLFDKSNDINKRVHLLETVNLYFKNELLVLLLDDLHRKLLENDIEIIKFISLYNLKNKENFDFLKKLKSLNVTKFKKEYTLLNKKNKENLN